jgi:hypothetical protein
LYNFHISPPIYSKILGLYQNGGEGAMGIREGGIIPLGVKCLRGFEEGD